MSVRSQLLGALALPGVARALTTLLRGRATVFMQHRLSDPDRGIHGNQPQAVRAALAFLRRERFEIVTLEEIVRRSLDGQPPMRGAVAFTLDDGYADQGLPTASLFAEFDCPATVFVTTGFLDGDLWMWWDQIEYVLRHTGMRQVAVDLGGQEVTLSWEDEASRVREQRRFTQSCKTVSDPELRRSITQLAQSAGVTLPEKPPPEYEPMAWSELRASERKGMQFAPHTVSHPVLSRTTDEQSRRELTVSRNRLREETDAFVPIFCYPNGQIGDYSDREFATLEELGFSAAVIGAPGYVERCASTGFERFQLRRFALADQLTTVIQHASGFERVKQTIRGGGS
jgi:peptidoglycan/xylan/chitin deacetylase (PgdA/CDA1 family)